MNSCEQEHSCQSGGRLAHWVAPNDAQVEYIQGASYDLLNSCCAVYVLNSGTSFNDLQETVLHCAASDAS